MIYIFTALYCEAKPLIEKYSMTPCGQYPFAGFSDSTGSYLLTLTGIGKTYSAAALSYIHSRYGITKDDFAVNIGTCAGGRARSGAYVINKVTDDDTGRSYYPDMIYDTGLPESALTTVSDVATGETVSSDDNMLWEMEASGFADIARLLMPPDRVVFIKAVSDNGSDGKKDLTEDILEGAVADNLGGISGALEVLRQIPSKDVPETPSDETSALFCSSESMKQDIRKLLIYCRNSGRDTEAVLNGMKAEGIIPAPDRRRGKEALDDFKKRIFQ